MTTVQGHNMEIVIYEDEDKEVEMDIEDEEVRHVDNPEDNPKENVAPARFQVLGSLGTLGPTIVRPVASRAPLSELFLAEAEVPEHHR